MRHSGRHSGYAEKSQQFVLEADITWGWRGGRRICKSISAPNKTKPYPRRKLLLDFNIISVTIKTEVITHFQNLFLQKKKAT